MIGIDRAAVLGSGVMGRAVAAHLANAGLRVLMLDIVPEDSGGTAAAKGPPAADPAARNRLADTALAELAKTRPAPLYLPQYAGRIETGNFTDDLGRLADCDWVIEAVIERLDVKNELFARIAPHLGDRTVLSTNTSGLSVNEMAAALPDELRRRFLVTHFFNPPRYMRLMEIVGAADTDPAVIEAMAEFIDRRLGKGIVYAKDTVNFIANRIGVYAICKAIAIMEEMGLTVEEVDAVSGVATARPKSAVFRTADLVGLDVLAHVSANSYELLVDDEERGVFRLPGFVTRLIEANRLGNKTGAGFYRKETVDGARQIYFYDYTKGDYEVLARPSFAAVDMAKQIDDPRERLRTVLAGTDKGADFAWRSLRDTLIYAFNRIPEIAADVVNIDNAMKWGFNWELGPFEILDAIGVAPFVERAAGDGVDVPARLAGVESFYRWRDGARYYFDLAAATYEPVPSADGVVDLEVVRRAGGVVEKSAGSSLLDLGDGVFCLEFHTKMNAIGGDILAMTSRAVQRAEDEGVGLVIANRGTTFSVGANLMLIAVALAEGALEDLDLAVRSFQKATMALKYATVPVVAAPFQMALGGGCEFCLHADAVCASAETYMGLVEVGVGLLPAGGGTKEMCIRAADLAARHEADVQPFIFKYFKQIAMGEVSRSAAELFGMGYLRRGDSITMNLDRLVGDAKQRTLALAANYRPETERVEIPAPGRDIAASITSQLWNMKMGGHISAYEVELGTAIAKVICGGDVNPGTPVSEAYLLDLERRAFLKLCTNPNTGARVQHMLKTGRPLRN